MIDQSYLRKILRALVHDLKGSLGTSAGLANLLKDKYHDKLDDKAIKWLNMIALEYTSSQSKLAGLSAYAQLIDYSPKLTHVNLAGFIDSWQSAFKFGCFNTLTSPQHYHLLVDATDTASSDKNHGDKAGDEYITDTYLLGLFLDELLANAISHADPRKNESTESTKDALSPQAHILNCQLSYTLNDSLFTICFKDNGRRLLESELDFIQAPFTTLQHSFTKSFTQTKTAGMGFARLFRIAELLDASLKIKIGKGLYPGLQVELSSYA
jgi:hypothetical protein